ncbi:MAG: hypothetical protein P1V20_22105 [Verrucomicrobiales bacterium]|nr:hypothetical protein [Verrucomicrobiales bacterium]
MRFACTLLVLLCIVFTSCTPDEHLQNPSRDAPVSYIPPPENVGPSPEGTSDQWIGPKGFQSKPSSQP